MTPLKVAEAVSHVTGITVEQIAAPCRKRPVVRARWLIMIILRQEGWVLTRIADALSVNHTTVMHGLEWGVEHLKRSKEYRRQISLAQHLCRDRGSSVAPVRNQVPIRFRPLE